MINWQRLKRKCEKEWKKDADKKKNKKNRNLSFQKYSEEGKDKTI